jgi:ribose 5-phosphate isomerase B
MIIYLGADHGGFQFKEEVKKFLREKGYEIEDKGSFALDPQDDFTDFAASVAQSISLAPDQSRGILFCRNGAGVSIAANKAKGIRCALCFSSDHAYSVRHDDDANILAIPADYLSQEDVLKITEVFLSTPFSGEERFRRRIQKISKLEEHA